MSVVVPFKWAPDPQDGRVSEAGEVDWDGVATSAVGDDAVAVEVARQTADQLGCEMVAVTLGRKNADWALARGADRVLVVDADLAAASESSRAAVLAAVIASVADADLVVIGDAAVDSGAAVVPSLVAGFLGWPGVLAATAVRVDGGTTLVERRTRDTVDVLALGGPTVVAVAADAATPRVPGMRDVLMARKRPVETVALASLDVDEVDVTLEESRRLDSGRQATLFSGEPQHAATQLVEALRAAQIL